MLKKVSIITVCYNCKTHIEKTIKSVLNQEYKNFEYIIVDGNSKDGTVDIIKSYEDKFKKRGILYKWISESDKGIYDAMNKGAKMAAGEWLYFLNVGDSFYHEKVLNNIFSEKIPKNVGILYGDVNLRYKNKIVIKKQENITKKYFLLNMINHQSMFIKKEIFDYLGGFNLDYKLCADKDLVMKILFELNYEKLYKDMIIANYDMQGASSTNFTQVWKENREISKKYHPIYLVLYMDFINCLRYVKKQIIGGTGNVFNYSSLL